MPICVLATCNLNQWSLDFSGNLQRIQLSIDQAREAKATYRVGPELELSGYGCEDHFLEDDTVRHGWECLNELIEGGYTDGIVCDIGMPVRYKSCLYNCRVVVLNRDVLLIRPKMALANDGNYRERRYFTLWPEGKLVNDFKLPQPMFSGFCPFGDAALEFNDCSLGCEICEELWTPKSQIQKLRLAGVDIVSNGSGSLHEVRKLKARLQRIQTVTKDWGGIYLYANQKGCDGADLYYDGSACIVRNGRVIAQGSQFGLDDVEVITACVDLTDVRRMQSDAFRDQSSVTPDIHRVSVNFDLCFSSSTPTPPALSADLEPKVHDPEEELVLGPACWLWDYMRRSGASGYLLSLSGGADSSATATIVGAMCKNVVDACINGKTEIEAEARRIGEYGEEEIIRDPKDFANRVFVTLYQGTEHSSCQTRAMALAKDIGCYHVDIWIDAAVRAILGVISTVSQFVPRFQAFGGTMREDLALQNIQARLRMVIGFTFSQLLPLFRGRRGFMIVLASANADETLRGYMTKYDCSSADLNPIGSFNKADVYRVLQWGSVHLGYHSLNDVLTASPTAELRPNVDGNSEQLDEVEMGMTYSELAEYGRLRRVERCGPVSMFQKLSAKWSSHLTASDIASMVKRFFTYYAINRHKTTTLTPSYHATGYAVDDRRYDHRPFLYNARWSWQFKKIDRLVEAETAVKEAGIE